VEELRSSHSDKTIRFCVVATKHSIAGSENEHAFAIHLRGVAVRLIVNPAAPLAPPIERRTSLLVVFLVVHGESFLDYCF
jgi:hypothetical protein